MGRNIAGPLPLLALLAGGCTAPFSPPTGVSMGVEPAGAAVPSQVSAAGPTIGAAAADRQTPVRLASYQTPADAREAAAKESGTQLPSLKLATDGPIFDMLRPSNDLDWSPDQAVLPYAEFQGDRVTVHNIRNATYRTVDDYTVRHYDKTFDLSKLTTVDFIVVPFADRPAIAHVMLSFGFEGKDYLVSSVEIRKRRGQSYSALAGFFNQYELMYVLADEHDVLWKCSIGWLQEVYLYRTKATPRQAKELFVDVMRRVNKLTREPEFYNTATNNCTTNVRDHINRLAPDRVPYDYHVLLPGYSDELAYNLGLLDTSLSFEETKARAKINYPIYLYREDPQLSQKVRQGL
jgi:hypothetical protein